jgi:anti-sigma regulatory factor (Ser/Thr protein kinase)
MHFYAHIELPCELTAGAAARHFLRQQLSSWELDTAHLDDALLLVSEVVANAVLHARTEIELTLRAADTGALRVEVYDDNSRLPTMAVPPDDATSGRGLQVIERLANRWGFERSRSGKTVWFELGDHSRSERTQADDVRSVEERLDDIEQGVGDDRRNGDTHRNGNRQSSS